MDNTFIKELMQRLFADYELKGLPAEMIKKDDNGTDIVKTLLVIPRDGKLPENENPDGGDIGDAIIVSLEVSSHDMEDANILQFNVYIHDSITKDERGTLIPFVDYCNLFMPYGHFGLCTKLKSGDDLLYYRAQELVVHEDGIDAAIKRLNNAFAMVMDALINNVPEIISKLEDIENADKVVEPAQNNVHGGMAQVQGFNTPPIQPGFNAHPQPIQGQHGFQGQLQGTAPQAPYGNPMFPQGQQMLYQQPMQSQGQPQFQEPPQTMFCPKCGNQIRPGAKFCLNCGQKL